MTMDDDEQSPRPVTTAPSRYRSDVADLSDPELVSRIGQGSYAALAEVYGRHGGPAHSLAARLHGTCADDIVQDIFLRLWQHPDLFDAERGSVRSFLMMQVRSRSVDLLRSSGSRRARETATWVEHTGPAAEDGALARLAGERSWSLLSRLDEGQRNAIALDAEVVRAQVLGCVACTEEQVVEVNTGPADPGQCIWCNP